MPQTILSLPDPKTEPDFYRLVTFKRLVAWIIDGFVLFALSGAIVLLTVFVGLFFLGAIWFVLGFLYRWGALTLWSATPGMRLMSIELRTEQGERLDNRTALLHTLGYAISVAITPLQIISVLLMIFRGAGQGLTDMVLRTAMINRPASAL
ncbi:RDD family protein [Ketogulonicigenium robustum]|uniref:RDD family protein n=1 Tax=Ketogulonicigenium robustum TaxID=92947 RepID=A0A1W6NYK8_9RHOB|nr:RDD family protein [Ketogulonicigenium robustum]ARO14304.1 RDD family protein [Ketogulonicigenium robustum]